MSTITILEKDVCFLHKMTLSRAAVTMIIPRASQRDEGNDENKKKKSLESDWLEIKVLKVSLPQIVVAIRDLENWKWWMLKV